MTDRLQALEGVSRLHEETKKAADRVLQTLAKMSNRGLDGISIDGNVVTISYSKETASTTAYFKWGDDTPYKTMEAAALEACKRYNEVAARFG